MHLLHLRADMVRGIVDVLHLGVFARCANRMRSPGEGASHRVVDGLSRRPFDSIVALLALGRESGIQTLNVDGE